MYKQKTCYVSAVWSLKKRCLVKISCRSEELYEAVGKNKLEPTDQIMIDGELVGGFNHLKEYLLDKGYINFQGEIIEKNV